MTTYTSQEAEQRACFEGNPVTKGMLCQLAALLRAREEAKPVAWRARFLGGTGAGETGWIVYDHKPEYSEESQRRWGLVILEPLFAHPPTDSAEAKDAARYRWLRDENNGAVISLPIEDDFLVLSDDALNRHIDAAMSAESREGNGS